VCGAEFNPCKGVTGIPPEQQPLNWRKVCCSVPCGSQFIKSVLESRGLGSDEAPAQVAAPAPPGPVAKQKRQRRPAPQTVDEQTEPAVTAEFVTEGTE